MFRSLMKDIIVCYLDSTLVVTKENSRATICNITSINI